MADYLFSSGNNISKFVSATNSYSNVTNLSVAGNTVVTGNFTANNISYYAAIGGGTPARIASSSFRAKPSVPIDAISVNGVLTLASFDVTTFNLGNRFNPTGSTVNTIPPYAFKPTTAGFYLINSFLFCVGGAFFVQLPSTITVQLNKNGVAYSKNTDSSSVFSTASLNELVYLNGTTDYIQIYFLASSGGASSLEVYDSSYFSAFFLYP